MSNSLDQIKEPTCTVASDVNLIFRVVPLKLSRRNAQVRVPQGTEGWYYKDGNLRGPYGSGEAINYSPGLLAPGWGVFPAAILGDRRQRAILVNKGPQRVHIQIDCPVPDFSQDQATFTLTAYLTVSRFEILASKTAGFGYEGGGQEAEGLNRKIAAHFRETVETSIKPLAASLYSRPELLTPSGQEAFKELILGALDPSGWGLAITDDPAPRVAVAFPPSLIEMVHTLRMGRQEFAAKLARMETTQRRQVLLKLEAADAKAAQEIEELVMRGVSPQLDWLTRNGRQLLDVLFSYSSVEMQERSRVFRAALTSRASADFYSRLIGALDRDWERAPSITDLIDKMLKDGDLSLKDWRTFLGGAAQPMDNLLWASLPPVSMPYTENAGGAPRSSEPPPQPGAPAEETKAAPQAEPVTEGPPQDSQDAPQK